MADSAAVGESAADMRRPALPGRSTVRRFAPAAVIAAGLALGYALGLHDLLSLDFLAQSRDALKAQAAAHPLLGPLALAFVYAVAVAFSFPAASVLTVFSGFLFGWLVGGLLAVVAATAGACLLFLAARGAMGGGLRAHAGSWPARLAEGFRQGAFGYLLVLRLAPFVPFFIVNIVPAFTGMRLRSYVGATFFGIMPGAFAYAWLGQGLDSVLTAAAQAGRSPRVADLVTPEITVAFAALAGAAALAVLARRLWASRAAA